MTNTFDHKTIAAVLALAILMIAGALFTFSHPQHAAGSTLAFAVPKVATSSLVVVGPQSVNTLAATSSNCVDRIVSTVGTAVQLSFSQNINPSATVGNVQGVSTTVAYNNGDYGCGAITGYAAASTSITVTTLTQ
jgi:low temperature requirement protein LtrA